MKKHIKLFIVVLTIVVMILLLALDNDMMENNDLYNLIFWVAIPIGSVIVGGQYLSKHLWLVLAAVFMLDMVLWLVAFRRIPLDDGYVMSIGMLCILIQEAATLAAITGIYVFRNRKKRRAFQGKD